MGDILARWNSSNQPGIMDEQQLSLFGLPEEPTQKQQKQEMTQGQFIQMMSLPRLIPEK